MDRSFRQKINKELDTLDQLAIVNIKRTFLPKVAEYAFSSNAHRMFSKRDHMPSHKTSLNKFNRIEIISSIFSDHNCMKLEINYRKKNGETQTCGD